MMRHKKDSRQNESPGNTSKRGMACFASTFGTTEGNHPKIKERMRHNKAMLAKINHQGTPVVIDDK